MQETLLTLENILTPPSPQKVIDTKKLNINQWGNQIHFYTGKAEEWKDFDIAFIGICDERLQETPSETPCHFNDVRKELYQLFNWHENLKLIDLGDLKVGNRPKDTYIAVEHLLNELIRSNVLPIFICNSQELTFAQFKAYEAFEKKISVANFDERIDLNLDPSSKGEESYIFKMLAHQPDFLENYYQLGYQNFWSTQLM